MQIRFLLGPAGSGKTSQCLAEIRRLLLRAPEGPPLLLLAPKQATYQLERRLLESPDLAGWSRLQILSFDRLARQILEEEGPVELLSEEGRLMVLRAILRRHQPELRIFRGAARLGGFVHELGTMLREFQRHQIGPERMSTMAARVGESPALAAKLHDLAILLRAYRDWLSNHGVLDADLLPDLAVTALRATRHPFSLESLWLDGFAEMTPQEAGLLVEVVRRTRSSHLTFCLDPHDRSSPPAPAVASAARTGEASAGEIPEPANWLSTWAIVSRTLHHCHTRLASLEGASIRIETLPGPGQPDRFASRPALGFLARQWTRPVAAPESVQASAAGSIELLPCPDAEAEAVAAAREIQRQVRRGCRYREIAVLLRSLDGYHAILERVFRRYGIPFFLDRRESLAHHPLAELTRSTLRLAAFQWQHDDWFAALKTNLTPAPAAFVDVLENRALASGWNGTFWPELAVREEWTPDALAILSAALTPFIRFQRRLDPAPSARELSGAIRDLWEDLAIREQLKLRIANGGPTGFRHRTAWEELLAWLENLERGFADERFPLLEWIPILESGLSALTAGSIPPSQDQVLIGAIDRSRQPELRVALVMGVNEGVFPAPTSTGGLLSEHDRDRLLAHGLQLGPGQRHRAGHERYFGYIACTRASEKLVLTWSERDGDGRSTSPSLFTTWIKTLFPGLLEDPAATHPPGLDSAARELARQAEHPVELLPWLLSRAGPTPLDLFAGDALRRTWLRSLRQGHPPESLATAAVEALHGREPEISVSALESLAACPFQFFARHSLRGTERARFEVDPRQSGSLTHEILAGFHHLVGRQGRGWRDVAPEEAPGMVETVAAGILPTYRGGLFRASPEARWSTDHLVTAVGVCVQVLVRWMATYRFDPVAVELAFGSASPRPPWRVSLGQGRFLRVRGKIDRLDVFRTDDGASLFCVLDYKRKAPRFSEEKLLAGIELQLSAYLLAALEVVDWPTLTGTLGGEPAGMFFIGIRNRPQPQAGRDPGGPAPADRDRLYQHRGRFRSETVRSLDQGIDVEPSGQFAAKFRKDGQLSAQSDGLPDAGFQALLGQVRVALQTLGNQLLAGMATPAPLRLGTFRACDGCEWSSVCRFDPRTDPFRKAPRRQEPSIGS